MSDFDPDDCAGGLCPPRMVPARLEHLAEATLWGKAPGELWWRRRAYCKAKDAARVEANFRGVEPGSEFAARPTDAGPPDDEGE